MADELKRLADTALTPTALRMAQRQFVGQMVINNDNALNEMQSIGKACLCFEHVDTLEEMSAEIMALTPADVLATAQRWLGGDTFGTLVYV